MKKSIICLILLLFGFINIDAQEKEESILSPKINKLAFEVRGDFDYYNDNTLRTAFSGKFINFILNGDLREDLHFTYRQRINQTGSNIVNYYSFWAGTDLLFLTYDINRSFSVFAGKLCVAIGGFEYDAPPIDIYYASNWWDRINCYELGAGVSYTTTNKNHKFLAQVVNSPFTVEDKTNGIFGFDLMWYGKMGHFSTTYSVNYYAYDRYKYTTYIALGNAFDCGRWHAYIDFLNRAKPSQAKFLLSDITAIGEVRCKVSKYLNLFVRGGYDRNDQTYNDLDEMLYNRSVVPGTSLGYYGGGVELFPFKGNKELRIHAFVAAQSGTTGYGQSDKTTMRCNIGVTWRLNFINK